MESPVFARALVVLALFASLAVAQTSDETVSPQLRGTADVPAYAEYDKKVRAAERLSPLDGELFGESMSLYTGATQFSHVDIDIPGNNALPVQLRRRFSVTPLARDQAYDGNGGPNNPYGGLGNWDIEVPMISGTFDQAYGWDFSPDLATRKPRCSQYFTPRTSVPAIDASAVWSGNKVHLPGQGEKELLRLDPTYPPLHYPTDGRAPTWTTSAFDAFSCLPTVSGNAGEGFLMTTPDGVSYRFDIYRERFYAPVKVGDATNRRKVVFLLASQVADRYGNTVSYTYDGYGHPTRIAAGDGRSITLTYDPQTPALLRSASVQIAIPGQAAQTRTWRYDYEGGAGGWRLIRVTLPDGVSQWTFDYNPQRDADDYLYVDYLDPEGACIRPNFNAPGFTFDIGHPSGSLGRFEFEMARQERTVPQPNCPAGTFLRTAYIDTYRLASKTIADTATSSSRWQYRYAQGTCPRCTNTVVVQPDDSTATHRFSNVVDAVRATPAGAAIEGQLLETTVRSAAGEELRRTANTYVTGPDVSNAPLGGYAFPSRYGIGGGDDPSSTAVRPLRSVATTQQGVTFTRTHDTFDAFARPGKITRTSALGTKVEATAYTDDKARWILGLVDTVINDALPTNPSVDNHYDALGNLVEVRTFGRIDRQMAWNADGTLASVTEGPDTATLGAFRRGIPQSVTYADGTRHSATIDDAGDIRAITDENGFTTSYGYDALRRLTSIRYPSDAVAWHPTTIAYAFVDGHWRQTTTTGTARKTVDYDRRLRPVLSSDVDTASPATQRYVRRGYDYAGRETFVSYASTDANEANGTTTRYDALGRMISTSQASELGSAVTTATAYQSGLQRQFTDGRGHVTTTRFLAYDEPDESLPVVIEATADASNRIVTTIGRDAFGKPTTLTRGGTGSSDVTRRYVYDAHQRLCKTIEPESGATVQAYNGANLVAWTASGQSLTSTADCQQGNVANNQKVGYTYDQRRRLKNTTYGDGSPDVRRSYTPDGLLATIASDNSVWTTTYNRRRLSTDETLNLGGVNYAIGYAHSRNGHVSGMTYPDATAVDYAPNALGEATRVGNYATAITTHPNGALKSFTYGNGIAHTTEQNIRGLPHRGIDAGVLSDMYAYDANANVTSITDERDASFTRTMTYDRLDRLISASASRWGTRSFDYDALDNLRSMGGGLNWTYQVDPATQRLTRIDSGAAALVSYTYDNRGRVTTRTVGGQSAQTFTTDLADRVAQIAPNGASYRYDGHGRRTSVTKNGVTTVQVYSQAGQLLYQSAPLVPSDGIFRNGFQQGDTNHAPQADGSKRYIYLGRHLIAEDGTAGRNYFHTDALGSPVRRTNSTGAASATAREDYQPYGWGPTPTSTPGFTGHVADAETGLVYMQARLYDPYGVRFLAVDPVVANEVSFNRYWYANNNPYRYVDPDGRCTGSRITNKEGVCVGSGATTTKPNTAYREFKSSDINVIASTTSKAGSANELSGTLAKDMNRVGAILRREGDEELVDILEKVQLVLDFNVWTAPNLVNAFAQADRRSMTITIAASRYASLETMYYRARNLVHEVRHLTLANDLLPGANDWARNPSERDAVAYAQEIMDKYWSEHVK